MHNLDSIPRSTLLQTHPRLGFRRPIPIHQGMSIMSGHTVDAGRVSAAGCGGGKRSSLHGEYPWLPQPSNYFATFTATSKLASKEF